MSRSSRGRPALPCARGDRGRAYQRLRFAVRQAAPAARLNRSLGRCGHDRVRLDPQLQRHVGSLIGARSRHQHQR